MSATLADKLAWAARHDICGSESAITQAFDDAATLHMVAAPVVSEPLAEPDTPLPPIPPKGHPLHTLGERLTHWLDDDQWNNAEPLLLEAYSLCSKTPVVSEPTDEVALDAERYRWLRQQPLAGLWGKMELSYKGLDIAIDDAIDAALAKEKP